VGSDGGFSRTLNRKELERYSGHGASGPNKGIEPVNVPWPIYVACSNGETIDVQTFIALHTVIDIDGLYDLLELQQVHSSWCHAGLLNARLKADQGR
jgi:hypothetical protein